MVYWLAHGRNLQTYRIKISCVCAKKLIPKWEYRLPPEGLHLPEPAILKQAASL
jgi:hypothetical protein